MRLIDADELIEHVWKDRLDSRERIANLVESIPSVKAVGATDIIPYSIKSDGTLTITIPKGIKVDRVLVQEDETHWGGLYYAE